MEKVWFTSSSFIKILFDGFDFENSFPKFEQYRLFVKNIEIKFVSFFSNKSKGQKRTKILVTNNQILSVITE